MTPRCPSDLALEGYLLERGASKSAPHAEACPACRARIARMEAEGREFLQYVYPATVAAVEEAAAPARSRWKRWLLLAPVPAVAGLAALLLVVRPGAGPVSISDSGETQIKGGSGSIGLTVFLGATDGARTLADGEQVPAGSALRFKIQPTTPCALWVVSVDAAGEVSRLYPATGESPAAMSQGGALPGGAVLDGRAGPERIFALCTPTPVAYGEVERAVRAAVGRGEQAVRDVVNVPGLPDGTSQATVLIHKRP